MFYLNWVKTYSKIIVVFLLIGFLVLGFLFGVEFSKNKFLSKGGQSVTNTNTPIFNSKEKSNQSSLQEIKDSLRLSVLGTCKSDDFEFYKKQCQKTEEALSKIDFSSLAHLDEYGTYYKDNKNVYIRVSYIETEYIVALNADPNTFKLLDNGWAVDLNSVYYGEDKIEDLSPKTFRKIGNYYVTDDSAVYFLGHSFGRGGGVMKKVVGADALSFFQISSKFYGYGSDTKNIFFGDKVIFGADLNTFKVLDFVDGLAFDKNNVFLNGEKTILDSKKLTIHPAGIYAGNTIIYELSDGINKLTVYPVARQ